MTYKDLITNEMEALSKLPDTIFLGENIINAGRIYGTLENVPLDQCIEMPICENLIAGAAIGLALRGYKPVVIFQRMDFMLIAADAIINHMCMIPKMSGGSIKLPIIIRAIVGSQTMHFDVGLQHKQNHSKVFWDHMCHVRITTIYDTPECSSIVRDAYTYAYHNRPYPTLITEYKDEYDSILN